MDSVFTLLIIKFLILSTNPLIIGEMINVRIATMKEFLTYISYEDNKVKGSLEIWGSFLEKALFANITWVAEYDTVGSLVSGDQYDGIIGSLQKHEADMGVFAVPMNIPYLPVLIGSVLTDYDVRILSVIKQASAKNLDIMDSFKIAFDFEFWVFFILSCILFIVLLSTINRLLFQVYDLSFILSLLVRLMLNQYCMCPRSNLIRGYIICFQISIFFIGAIYVNLFITNFIVNEEPKVIDSLKDLVDRNMKPIFIKDASYYNELIEATDGVNKLVWDQVIKFGLDQCLIRLYDGPAWLRKQVEISNSTAVYVSPTIILPTIGQLFLAYYPNSSLYLSNEGFDPSLYTFVYSKNISLELRRRLDSRLRWAFDLGISIKNIHILRNIIAKDFADLGNMELKSTHKMDLTMSRTMDVDDPDWNEIKFHHIYNLILLLIYSYAFAVIILILELLWNIFSRFKHKTATHRIRN